MKKMYLGQSYNWVYPLDNSSLVKVPLDEKAHSIARRVSDKIEAFFSQGGGQSNGNKLSSVDGYPGANPPV